MTIFFFSAAVIPVTTTTVKVRHLAMRGCLVQVRTDRCSPKERWFAVGIYLQRAAEAAVCGLPQIGPAHAVFARRPLKRAEIETLSLRSRQVVECSVSNDTIRSQDARSATELKYLLAGPVASSS